MYFSAAKERAIKRLAAKRDAEIAALRFKVGDLVVNTRAIADGSDARVIEGTPLQVMSIAPKVRMVKGDGYDGSPYFAVLRRASGKGDLIRTNFCNLSKS